MAGSGKIKQSDLNQLVHHMSKKAFRAKDATVLDEKIMSHCLTLCGKDYKYSVLDNKNGELCNHYPPKLILLEYECRDSAGHHESIYNMQSLTDMFRKDRFARCRTRFVVPVILIEGKHICRSATISGSGELYGRLGLNLVFNGERSGSSTATSDEANNGDPGDMQALDRIRRQDIKLLKELRVNHICDLMLENKKVKYFLNVTSSEKVDKLNRYSDFSLWSLPYPGCEFFKVWRDRDYDADRIVFDWSQEFVNSELELPQESPHLHIPDICWKEYKTWSLIKLTQNYLNTILRHVQSGDSGLLVHCISGWDRTPLFISLVRLSLWADGLVHKSLSSLEILYFTVAYDWYQFGHDLPDRLQKGEEIMFFCFYFLKFIQSEEFIVHFPTASRSRNVSSTDLDMHYPMGVLLDADFPPFGSSSSLCSDQSMSSRSDAAPQLFMVESTEKDGTMTSCPSSSALNGSRPVSVPLRVADSGSGSSGKRSDSPSVGSWQVVTGTGSYVESVSPHSGADAHRRLSSSGEFSRHSASLSDLHHEPSPRRTRLEEVRSLFYHAYASTVGFKNGAEDSSTLLDMFTDKMVALGNKLA